MRMPRPKIMPVALAARWPGFVGLAFGIALLNLLTIGLYKPYGVTRARRALYREIYVGRDPLAYEGDARSLSRVTFYPSLAFLVMLLVPGVVQIWVDWQSAVLIGVLQLVGIMAYYQYLAFLSRQYELSQISWRGYGFTLNGSAFAYMRGALTGTCLNILTLGVLAPRRRTALAELQYGDMHYGRHQVRFNLDGDDLWVPYLLGWALSWLGWAIGLVYYWRVALVPLRLLLEGGTADPAMAQAVDPAMFSGEMGGAPDQATLAEMGTYMNALTLSFIVLPAVLLWQKLALAWYEHCWWSRFFAAFQLGETSLRYDGSALVLCALNCMSWALNMFTANLTRPFTTYMKLRFFTANVVVTNPEPLESLIKPAFAS